MVADSRRLVKRLLVLILPFLQAAAFDWKSALASSPATKDHVIEDLTDSDFEKFLKEHPVTAVLFYAPWCFYSQQTLPQWDLAAQKLALHDPPVTMTKIDASKYGSIAEQYGLQGFPAIKLFVNGAVFNFDAQTSGRGWLQIVKWVNTHLERDHVISDVQGLDDFVHNNDLFAVGLFAEGHNNTAFATVANQFEDIMFAEARGALINEIAEHLARRAALRCETISIGGSDNEAKTVQLPRTEMECFPQPRNPQRPEWTDAFGVQVEGASVKVTRADTSSGWLQMLQIQCCDKSQMAAAVKIPVPSVVMFMPHDERYAILTEGLDNIDAVDRWVNARRTPMIMNFDETTLDKIMPSGPEMNPVLFLIQRANGQGEETPEAKIFKEAASLLRGRVMMVMADFVSNIERRLIQTAGIEEGSFDTVITLIESMTPSGPHHQPKKYRPDMTALSVSSLTKFIDDYENGRLRPWLKTEPEPSDEDIRAGGAVIPIVGTNFFQNAYDVSKDVLVNFYAPWCGHCRKLEPLYAALGRKLKHVQSLRILKLDATRNEVEGMQIQGFPTIILFKAGSQPKQLVQYQGNRSPEDFITWLHEHCSIPFDDAPPPKPQKPKADRQVAYDSGEGGLLDPSEEDL